MINFDYEKETERILRQLGVNGSYIGYWHTLYGVTKTIENPKLTINVCKGLYLEVATKYGTSINSVERNIRTVLDVIWNNGDRALLSTIVGYALLSKPNNTSFIDGLAFYVSNLSAENK
ncbi:MAG: hypothetical protein E7266_08005 [Lachnospiraceae bacterium]|nr:hypothetical protein [Lachnospiraceae bacterium]